MVYKYISNSNEGITRYLKPACNDCIPAKFPGTTLVKCPITGLMSRMGFGQNTAGNCFICSSQKNHVQSPAQFKIYLEARLGLLSDLNKYRAMIKASLSEDFGRLVHNLTSLNAHNSQELYAVVPQEIATKNLKNCINTICKMISSDPMSAARAFFQVQKNCAAIKTEFDVYRKLYIGSGYLTQEIHAIHPVILNVFYTFFQDFADKRVYVDVKETTESVLIDYETVRVALYHLFQNAAKYVCPTTVIYVEFNRNALKIEISLNMISLPLTNKDMEHIWEEGYSGELAREFKLNGEGRGMTIVKKALEINGGSINIKRDIVAHNRKLYEGVAYVNNHFEITLPRSKK